MPDREKVFDALRNCITEPKCKDCPWETCEEFHQTKTIPLDLCLDILELLKEDCHNCKLECLLQKYDQLKEKYDKLLKEQTDENKELRSMVEFWKEKALHT